MKLARSSSSSLALAVWPSGGAGAEADHLDGAGQDVGQRKEHQGPGAGLQQDLGQEQHDVLGDQGEVAVRDFAALGPAGGAGGVDEGRDVGEAGRGPVPFQLGVADAGARGGQAGEVGGGAVVVHPDHGRARRRRAGRSCPGRPGPGRPWPRFRRRCAGRRSRAGSIRPGWRRTSRRWER